MYLKRLETIGFKSFAERIDLEFVPGVTAVVGPNGSGKSNIIDAIRWVLGEQSARSLRGMRMEDIIFQGSETRKPLNMAEVTIVLDNSSKALPVDYEEVSVTRRVYRSGESEFYLNKTPCRLKDIIDLFIDSGLGREAFSIIGQGRVDEILNSKAEERRTIFEEAAGVLKYKQRKQQAEFKLIDTSDNLSRVQDIVYELETQIEPISRQRENALKFKQYEEELKMSEVSLLVTEIEELHTRWTSLVEEFKEFGEKITEEEATLHIKAAQVEKRKSSIEQLDRQMNTFQNELVLLTEQIEKQSGQKSVILERFKHLSVNKQQIEQSLEGLIIEKSELTQNVEQASTLLKNATDKVKETEQELERNKRRLLEEEHHLDDQLAKIEKNYIEHLNEQAVFKNELTTLQKNIDLNLQQTTEQKEQLNLFVYDIEQLERELIQLKNKRLQLQKQRSASESEAAALEELLEDIHKEIEQVNKSLSHDREQLASIQSRADVLLDMQREMQGLFTGPKRILQAVASGDLAGVHGIFMQLIDVPEQYSDAIEAILGNQVQNIVTETEKDARIAIEWLKRHKIGRATFLPIEAMRRREVQKNDLKTIQMSEYFIGILSDLIRTENRFKLVVEALVGNVIVMKDLKSANDLARRTSRKYRIVTLDGDIVFPGGSMSGGAKKQGKTSLFSREKELKRLERQEGELVHQIDEKQSLKTNLQVRLAQILEKKKQCLATLEKQNQSFEKESDIYRKKQHEHQIAVERMQLFHTDHETFMTNRLSMQEEIERLEESIHTNQTMLAQLAEERQKVEKQKTEREAQSREKELQLFTLEKEIALELERKNQYEIEFERLTRQLESVDTSIAQQKIALEELESLQDLQLQQETVVKTYEALMTKREEVTNHIENLRRERQKLQQLITDEERELKATGKYLQNEKEKQQEKEIEVNRLDVALESRLGFLQEEYQISFERAAKTYARVRNIDRAKENVEQIKQKIKRLGPVNLGAIEEYDRLTDRLTFLLEQKEDLEEAKATLYEAIAEMDQKMQTLFKETFSQIQDQFTAVFQRLFNGGHAELILTDDQNILETGIEIVAQPPGKKLRNLSLLSGGERALTAIALLFAILKVRPVPFCVLDEVEAALDEANVTRFSKYLHEFSEDTQFIVITHRKGTMEEADVLYGVTMAESGVSRFVSVRLSEAEDFIEP